MDIMDGMDCMDGVLGPSCSAVLTSVFIGVLSLETDGSGWKNPRLRGGPPWLKLQRTKIALRFLREVFCRFPEFLVRSGKRLSSVFRAASQRVKLSLPSDFRR